MNTTTSTPPPVFSAPDKTTDLPVEMQIVKDTVPTKGEERVHNFAHKTINFWANYGFSLLITDFFLGHTATKEGQVTSMIAEASGSKSIQKASDWVKNKMDTGRTSIATALNKRGMSEKISHTVADTAMDIFTLMMGGHITASIATYILNRSDQWAKKFDEADDRKKGYTPSPEEREAREARYEYLRNQPKKTAWTVIKSRLLGFVLNTGVLGWLSSKADLRTYYMDPNDLKGKRVGIRSFTQGMANTVTDFARNKSSMSEKALGRLNYWAELAPFEALCTLNTSLALKWIADDTQKKPKPLATTATHASGSAENPPHDTPPAARDDSAPNAQSKWAETTATKREPITPREQIQPAEIRNQQTAQYVLE